MRFNRLTIVLAAVAGSITLAGLPQAGQAQTLAAKEKKLLKGKIDRDVMMADEMMLKGKFGDAEKLYKEALNRNAKNPQAMVGLGMALGKQFKLDAAEEQFDKVLNNFDSNNALAHSGKAMVLMNRLASSSMTVQKQRDSILKAAETEAVRALQIDPGMPEAHYTLGSCYKEQGRLTDAAKEYSEAIRWDPQYADAYVGLGLVRLMQNNPVDASQQFKTAIQHASGNASAHYGLGKAMFKQGMVDGAIKELNTALALKPDHAPAHMAMGECYQQQGNSVAALNEYDKSILFKPENAEAYLHKADIRDERGDLELSISELRQAISLMPNNPDLHLRVADECLKLEKLDDALKEYKTTLDIIPGHAGAVKGMTRTYYLKAQKEATGAFTVSNEFEDADRMIQQAIKLNPNDMELRLAQAKLRALSGAPVDLNAVGSPQNDGERIAYAEALLAQNKFKEASDQMNIVIGNAGDMKQAFSVADLALMIKDLDDAEKAYNKARSYPGAEERAKRGLSLVAKQRESARQDLTMADDLAKKKQTASAIDKYHSAIFGNPKVSYAHLGLAQTLEKVRPETSAALREAITQYNAFLSLEPNMPLKEQEKYKKKLTSLDEKAYKLEQKAKQAQR